ncbi:WD repeat-containing protein 46 isoform X2 [Gopherus flavomarginatus]|uniref:WD repeat-containing protein 46 isoform X2 n=1 Tax=Gopherus flavomarginatus TaxID=286002 RepID=UPI0021CBA00E|nr:WD repeat-containing protein 46 isoform X2 [Gopherus flavomarginatus]
MLRVIKPISTGLHYGAGCRHVDWPRAQSPRSMIGCGGRERKNLARSWRLHAVQALRMEVVAGSRAHGGSAGGGKKKKMTKKLQRYWEGPPLPDTPAGAPSKAKRRRNEKTRPRAGAEGSLQARKKRDPFPGAAPLPQHKVKKFQRGQKSQLAEVSSQRLRDHLALLEQKVELAVQQAARMELLLPEEPGFLEGDPGEDTCTIAQADIAKAADIASATKHFELTLNQFGPYRMDYTRPGRHLLLGGRRGHVAALDWQTKSLLCEINIMETVTDVTWLHTENMFAVAQRRWLYVYDNQGVELNCLKRFNGVLRMEFLPYHFLLATASETGFLQYLDISVGKEVATICTRGGRLGVMGQNPANAIIHLGHSNGTVTLWSPNIKEPLVRMLCHRGGVRAVAVDSSGMYMATSGLDRKLHIYDLRAYQPVQSLVLPVGAGHLSFSQRGLLAATCGEVVQVYRDVPMQPPHKPYLSHTLPWTAHGLRFCPFEDVLGVGHGSGFTSLLVPGAGQANFDALENNPFRSRKQRQEWEVKALLEKIPSELITLDPGQLGQVDAITMEQKHHERVQRLGFDPQAKPAFQPRRKLKGRSSAGSLLQRKRKVANEEQRTKIRKSLEQQQAVEQERKAAPRAQSSALDRFRK